MGYISEKLELIEGHFISLTRNTVEGYYELEIGLPTKWIYKSNNLITCELVKETKIGNLLRIKPKPNKKNIKVDDLFEFAFLIVKTNEEIAEREKEFEKKMEGVRKNLESEINNFYEELERKRKESFEGFDKKSTPVDKNNSETIDNSKKRRGRPPKPKLEDAKKEETK